MTLAFDLEFFAGLASVPPLPADVACFKAILAIISHSEPETRANRFQQQLAPLLKTNKYIRMAFLETLAACSILKTQEYKGVLEQFVPFSIRQHRPHKFVECDPPLAFWRGQNGINKGVLQYFFPQNELGF